MKQLFLFIILFFLVFKIVASVESSAAELYHGNRRYWMIEVNGKTHVALHILKEPIRLIFPKEKTFADLTSDIKLYSPSNKDCRQDATNNLNFTLVITKKDHIRGLIMVNIRSKEVTAFLYDKCNDVESNAHYAFKSMEGSGENLQGADCFRSSDAPFQVYDKDTTKYVMGLQVSGTFECQAFMELPLYMQVEDVKLPEYGSVQLNETFDGHDDGYWWKNKNDEMLPSTVSFDENKNVIIDILNSTVIAPYFFRIGNGQPIPSFKFNFGSNCVNAVFAIYLNLKKDCQVLLKLNQNGFTFSTSLNPNKYIQGLLSAIVFGGNKVFVKAASPLSINEFETCEISNPSDVPSDQFVLQIASLENIGDCEKAEILLANSDVVNGIEVLIDRTKIIENSTETSENFTASSSTAKGAAPAGLQWWWFLLIGLIFIALVVAITIYVCFIRPCLQKQKKSKMPIVMVESVDDEEERRHIRTTKTAVSPESKTAKEKTKTKDDGEKKAPVKVPSKKPVQPPPLPIPAAPRKPLPPRQLKYRCMYGDDGFTKMDEPFDYHIIETDHFKETKTPAIFNEPDTRIHYNFWDCLKPIFETKMECEVFADRSNRTNSNVYFMVRDLVDRDGFYAPCLKLSNRVLECFDFNPRPDKPIYQPVDKEGNKIHKRDPFYMLRIFILSYDPLTIEIHCRGPWPFFIFDIFDCEKCIELFTLLDSNKWQNSPVTCIEDWQTFTCRVKRTPINSHQFLTYYGHIGAVEPEDPNDIHNILIIRGNRKPNKLRECSRGCFFTDNLAHRNKFKLETPLRNPPTAPK